MRLTVLILFFAVICAKAQEALRPLTANVTRYSSRETESTLSHAARTTTSSLQLPFKDDFSYATSRRTAHPTLWVDTGYRAGSVYVNTGYAIAPPSIGVATFDGLDANGYPHDPTLNNLTLNAPADVLVSRPINLQVVGTKTLMPSDSIGLLFYYQARGYGDAPEVIDTLFVDLFDPTNNRWDNNVWWEKGISNPNIIDTTFKRGFIRIDSAKYLKENFQFRFRNRATVSGDFDHWHVDYVLLDQGIYNTDRVFDDLTFAYPATSILRDYSAMPFHQFRGNELTDHFRISIKNNNDQAISMSYKHQIFDENGTEIFSYNGGPANLFPFADTGYSRVPPHTDISLLTTFTNFPTLTDSTDFTIRHVLFREGSSTGSDYVRANDTLIQTHSFKNYYAFDDGGAEAGYYVNGSQARMALRVRLNESDSLQALRIYFDPAGNIQEAEKTGFRIHVWSEDGNIPSVVPLHSLTTVYLQKYTQSPERAFAEYTLPEPIALEAGVYFIGIQQQATTVTVGFDRNYDASRHLFYNAGNGWKQSQIRGALMMRPVFGKKVPAPVGMKEEQPHHYSLYPNPANTLINISGGNDQPTGYTILDMQGVQLLNGHTKSTEKVDISSLHPGIYLVVLRSREGAVVTKKLVVSR